MSVDSKKTIWAGMRETDTQAWSGEVFEASTHATGLTFDDAQGAGRARAFTRGRRGSAIAGSAHGVLLFAGV